jgi:hypothetical protein
MPEVMMFTSQKCAEVIWPLIVAAEQLGQTSTAKLPQLITHLGRGYRHFWHDARTRSASSNLVQACAPPRHGDSPPRTRHSAHDRQALGSLVNCFEIMH